MSTVPVPQIFALALQHLQAGRLHEAEALYRRVLAAEPGHARAWHHLGIIAHQAGRDEIAVDLIGRAIGLVPEDAAAHLNLGEAYRTWGRLEEAAASARRAVELRPEWAEAHHGLGFALAGLGKSKEALAEYRRALELRPELAVTWNNLGNALKEEGQFAEAVAAYGRALELQPRLAEAQDNLGVALVGLGRLEEAEAAHRRAMELRPDFAAASNNLGNVLKELRRPQEALASYRRALALQPDFADAWNNLGVALAGLGEWEQAVEAYRRALAIQPSHLAAENNLGNAFKDQDQLEAAAACYRRTLELDPGFADGHLNLGVVWWLEGRLAEAEDCYRRALECRGEFADAHLNLALLLLLSGRYAEGWREYEWRWRSAHHGSVPPRVATPRWDGRPLPGGTLFVHVEQGFGDTLLYLRYLPGARLRSQAARVILECQPELRSLLEPWAAATGIELIAVGAPDAVRPAHDWHLALLSLPLALGDGAPLPPMTPALLADAGLRERWREGLGEGEEMRVGVVWAGNPGQREDRKRSMDPEMMAPILRVPGVRFYSLQVGAAASLAGEMSDWGIWQLPGPLTNFADTAAVMTELDLVITVDTATAHLAGTLGCPVWVMVRHVPYWPYGLSGESTPWYPGMRIFRQERPGDWDRVVQRVAAALRDRGG
jgi:tetratricopeptide (TPR) repeat protein